MVKLGVPVISIIKVLKIEFTANRMSGHNCAVSVARYLCS